MIVCVDLGKALLSAGGAVLVWVVFEIGRYAWGRRHGVTTERTA